MELAIVISTKNAETNWNAFRLANFASQAGDIVKVFLVGEGVEYEEGDSEKFDIHQQVKKFLQSEKTRILACGACVKARDQESTATCPINSLKDLHTLIKESDKVISF